MLEEKQTLKFICSSSEWTRLIEGVDTFEEAAAAALREQIDLDEDEFSVGAVISVTPVQINNELTRLIYAPSVLADIGLHKHAAEMIKQIDKNDTPD